MSKRTAIRAGVLLFVAGAISGIAYAAARPLIDGNTATAIQAGDVSARAATVSPSTIAELILKELKAKKIQAELESATLKELKTESGQTALLAALTAADDQAKLNAQLDKEIQTSVVQQQLTKTLDLNSFLKSTSEAANSAQLGGVPASNFTQGPAKIVTGQATTPGNSDPVTVLTVPGLLHVEGLWWPSDGTVQFEIFNDSAHTLDFGGDFNRFPYGDTFPSAATEFGELTGLGPGDGKIAPGGSENFQITPRADAVDLNQSVPYAGEAHIQVTAPGSAVVTLDMSAYEIAQNSGTPGVGGSALLSGQAVVGPA